jgi:hypothetical protein
MVCYYVNPKNIKTTPYQDNYHSSPYCNKIEMLAFFYTKGKPHIWKKITMAIYITLGNIQKGVEY